MFGHDGTKIRIELNVSNNFWNNFSFIEQTKYPRLCILKKIFHIHMYTFSQNVLQLSEKSKSSICSFINLVTEVFLFFVVFIAFDDCYLVYSVCYSISLRHLNIIFAYKLFNCFLRSAVFLTVFLFIIHESLHVVGVKRTTRIFTLAKV